MRLPSPLRRFKLLLDQGGSTPPGMPAKLSLGHAMDVVHTRDVWLHRIDIARATGHSVDLDSGGDRRVVEDVVAEWAGRHGQPFHLTLTGPDGGEFRHGEGEPHLELDPAEFCQILSGRAPGDGLLATACCSEGPRRGEQPQRLTAGRGILRTCRGGRGCPSSARS